MIQQEKNEIFKKFGEGSVELVEFIEKCNKKNLVDTLSGLVLLQKKIISELEDKVEKLEFDRLRFNQKIKNFFEVF